MRYNAFVSYSHAADGALAPALQRSLQRLARPWHRKRALEVFRDQTGLGVTPALWTGIRSALEESEYFILLASPGAAASPWVNQEIDHWLMHHSVDRLLPVLTDGEWTWDKREGDFDWNLSTAVPSSLRRVFREEPRHLDLRWARSETQLDLRHGRFRDAVAELAAPMHGMAKEDLDSEDVIRHRRMLRLRRGVIAALCVMLLLIGAAGSMAIHNARSAAASAERALRQERLADQQRIKAAASAEEARRQQRIAEAQQSRAKQAAAEARRQQAVAEDERVQAERAALEARRQGRVARAEEAKAVDAAAEASRQRQIAEAQEASAATAAWEAERQRRIARVQQATAATAASEAERQRRIAQAQQASAEAATAEARRQALAAQQQERLAFARKVLAEADALRNSDPRTALLLGIAAQRVSPSAQSQANLVDTLANSRYAGSATGHTQSIESIAFSPDGKMFVTAGQDKTARLWKVSEHAAPEPLGGPLIHSSPVTSATLTPDGWTLVTSTQDATVTLWDLRDPSAPRRVGRPLAGAGSTSAVAYSAHGRILATASQQGQVTLWDIASPAAPEKVALLRSDFTIQSLALSPDGKTLALGGSIRSPDITFGLLGLWDLADPTSPEPIAVNQPGSQLLRADNSLTEVAFSPDGRTLTTGGGGKSMLWDLAGKSPISGRIVAGPGAARAVLFGSGSKQLLASVGPVGGVSLWDVSAPDGPRQVSSPLAGYTDAGPAMAFSPDGRLLVTASAGGTAMAWRLSSRAAPVHAKRIAEPNRRNDILALSPDGRLLATTDQEGTTGFKLWDVTARTAPRTLGRSLQEGEMVDSAAFTPDHRTLVATSWKFDGEGLAGFTGYLTVYDVVHPASPRLLSRSPRWLETGDEIVFASGGDFFASLDPIRTSVALWDIRDRTRPTVSTLRLPLTHQDPAAGIALTPDGRTLAVGVADKVMIWSIENRARLRPLGRPLQHDHGVTGVSFDPDGRTLAVNTNQSIVLWDLTNRGLPHRQGEPLRYPRSLRQQLAPDWRTMVTSDTQTVTFFDMTDRSSFRRLGDPLTNDDYRYNAVFSSNGELYATSDDKGNVTLWDAAELGALRRHAEEQACAITGRGLNRDEWRRHLSGLRYQETCG
jgi:WD40 repeat protein